MEVWLKTPFSEDCSIGLFSTKVDKCFSACYCWCFRPHVSCVLKEVDTLILKTIYILFVVLIILLESEEQNIKNRSFKR